MEQISRQVSAALAFGFFLVSLGYLAACGSARRSEPIMGPLELNTPVLEKGQVVFMQHCQRCHPGGEAGVGPSVNNVPLPGVLLKFRVRSRAFFAGAGRMPSFKKHEISTEELRSLVAYLKVLRKHDNAKVSKSQGS